MSMTTNSSVRVTSPNDIHQNPENPRLVFREKDLAELEDSIASNGILVPLTVYQSSAGNLVLLDGERRWRCAKKLGLHRVPIIVQPEPTLMQNIMMMFAIHNARSDWDPLPTALKLRQLEELYVENEGRSPTESQLAQLASLSRGEVRRLKNILALPKAYLDLIKAEQDLPRSEQSLTVDHLLEVTRGAAALARQGILDYSDQGQLEQALISKFQKKALTSTVEPRLLTRMARAVERGDIPARTIRDYVDRLVEDPTFTIQNAFDATVRRSEDEHNLELSTRRLIKGVNELSRKESLSQSSELALKELRDVLNKLFRD